jgi:hypothetical protein
MAMSKAKVQPKPPINEGVWLNRQYSPIEALIMRVFAKHHYLKYKGEDRTTHHVDAGAPVKSKPRERNTMQTPAYTPLIGIYRSKKAKEQGMELGPSDTQQIKDMAGQLGHILRPDDAFFREVVRVYHRRMNEVYPLGRGCDLTPSFQYVRRAEEAVAAGHPFYFWVLMITAARKGFEICEEYRGRPLVGTRGDGPRTSNDADPVAPESSGPSLLETRKSL